MRIGIFSGIAFAGPIFADEPEVKIHSPDSPHQRGATEMRVVTPDDYEEAEQKRYRVLYVLPVEREFANKFGSGLDVLTDLDAHNRHDLILVRPAFEVVPWYGNHATDPRVRQADYLAKSVVPYIERNYRTKGDAESRLLLGFSKSGWGAFSLILRAPDFWGYAAAWDAPMMLDRQIFGTDRVFGTEDQLDRFRPDLLVRDPKLGAPFRKRKRLVLAGEKFWGVFPKLPTPGGGSHTAEFHRLLESRKILHHYDNSLAFPHRWDRLWVEPTLTALMKLANRAP